MKQSRHFKYHQSGQGLVEYAILLLLTITLVIGGIELTATALASGKAKDAAEAGANEFSDLNEQRIKLQKNQQAYLEKLNSELTPPLSKIKAEFIDLGTNEPAFDKSQFNPIRIYGFENGSQTNDNEYFDNFVIFLDYFANKAIFDGLPIWSSYIDFFDPDSSYFITKCLEAPATPPTDPEFECTDSPYTNLDSIVASIDGILDPNGNGELDSADPDGTITRDELKAAIDLDYQFNIKQKVLNLSPANNEQRIARYKTLILLDQVALSLMQVDPRLNLSESELLIGDHNPLQFVRPNCIDNGDGTTDYDNGLPGSLIDVNEDGLPDNIGHFTFEDNSQIEIYGVDVPISGDYPAVYLFNPKPIDAGSCQGVDGNRNNRSRLSVLVNGYGYHLDANFVKGMPKVHEAYLGQYTNICLDGANEYVACGSANVTQQLLKPTGKLCLSSAINPTVDSCPDIDPDYIDSSGYYFWGIGNAADPSSNDSERYKWIYSGSSPPEFRPTYQLVCNGGRGIDNDPDVIGQNDEVSKSLVVNNACLYNHFEEQGEPHHVRSVRVNVRYRSIFESFLTMGLQTLQDNGNLGLENYFYDPSNLRALPSGSVGVPIAGSELGPKSNGTLPTVKPFKDFRGCYEVQVETNSISSCN